MGCLRRCLLALLALSSPGCGAAETPPPTRRLALAADGPARLNLRVLGAAGPLVARAGLFRGETSLLTFVPLVVDGEEVEGEGSALATPLLGASEWRTRRQDFVPGPDEEYVYVEAESAFSVEPGPLRLVVTRGIFRAPVVRELELRPGRVHDVEVALDAPIERAGLSCADLHLHVGRFDASHDEDLGALVAAEELEHAAFVDWAGRAGAERSRHWGGWAWTGDELTEELSAPFFAAQAWGRPDRACALHAFGHQTPVTGRSKHSQASIIGRADDEGALVAGALGRIFVEGALLGRVHASEVLSLGQWKGLEAWYDVLNVGARVAAIAGTDSQLGTAPQVVIDYHSPIGANRVCATAPDGDRAAFMAAVRAGRSFVTNGPRLDLRVGEVTLGGTHVVEAGASVEVDVRLLAPTVPGGRLVLLRNGELAGERAADARELRWRQAVTIDRSSWFAVRLEGAERVPGGDVPMAHTSPLWVTVGDAPVFEAASADRVAEAIASADDIRTSGQSNAEEREASASWAERARAVLSGRRPRP